MKQWYALYVSLYSYDNNSALLTELYYYSDMLTGIVD